MNIADFITSACLVEDYDTVRDGSFRLATPFRYPDGSHIDVFLKDGGTVFDGFELSDKGQTVAYLDLHVNPWSSQRCKQTMSGICTTLGVEQEGGVFRIRLPKEEMNDLPDAILRLGQACIRIADLSYTQRLRAPVALSEDFEEFVSGLDRPYQTGVKVSGQFGKEVEFDFSVEGTSIMQGSKFCNRSFEEKLLVMY